MPKRKCKNGEEWLRGKVRELEKQNRALKRQLKFIEKKEHIFDVNDQDEEVVADNEDTYPDLKKQLPCHDCGKGFLIEYEIMGKVIGTCGVCGHREKIK